MPNSNIRTGLDTICLLSPKSILKDNYNPVKFDPFTSIEYTKKERKNNLQKMIQSFDFDEESKPNRIKEMMKTQSRYAPNKTMRICHQIPIAHLNKQYEENIAINVSNYGFSFSGLNRCKNPYCVMCSKSRAGERTEKIRNGIIGAGEKGYQVYFVTLTIPRQDCIKKSRNEIVKRWKAISRVFEDMKKDYSEQVYFARALDITFNPYIDARRYHLHVHSVIIIEGNRDDDIYKDLILNAWLSQNSSKCKAQLKCQDFQKVNMQESDMGRVSRYTAKMAGLALEVLSSQKQETKSKDTISFVQLLEDSKTKPKSRKIYREFLEGMKRMNTLTFSRNWKDLYQIEETEKPYNIDFEIPLENWQPLKPLMYQVAEKLRFEIFENSFIPSDKTPTEIKREIGNCIDTKVRNLLLKKYLDKHRINTIIDHWERLNMTPCSSDDFDIFICTIF